MVDVDKNYTIYLNEQGPQGATGPQGLQGETGATPDITINATVNDTVGTPNVEVEESGSERYPSFLLKFTNIKGNGIVSIEKTSTSVLTDTYTITYENGDTTTYEVENGNGIDKIEKTATSGLTDTYTITFTDGSTFTYSIDNGKSITGLEKVSTIGLIDTYRISYNDGSTYEYEVVNGNGVTAITKGASSGLNDTYTITYGDGSTFDYKITNGRSISNVTKTSTSGKNVTYTISYNDGTTSTFVVTNGADAAVSIGTVTTGAAGSSAKVTNSGTSSNAVLNFTIPRGDTITEDALIGGDDVELDSSDDSINVGGVSRIYDVVEDNDSKAYAKVKELKNSTFDLSKFTVVGSPTITEDGIASGFSAGKYITKTFANSFSIKDCVFRGKITAPRNSSYTQNIIFALSNKPASLDDTVLQLSIFETAGQIALSGHSNGVWSGWYSANGVIEAGEEYYFKTYFDSADNTINCDISLDGVYFTNVIHQSIEASESLVTPNVYIGSIQADKNYYEGQIDLKSFSITADGVEVFNGNKTGIDTIKSDNYTVVGSPTISDGGIATITGNGNYLYPTDYDIDITKPFKVTFQYTFKEVTAKTANSMNFALGDINTTRASKIIGFIATSTDTIQQFIWYNSSATEIARHATVSKRVNLVSGDIVDIEITGDGTTLTGYVYVNGELTRTEYNTFEDLGMTTGRLNIGQGVNFNNFIVGDYDLNTVKIYVDGDLVYQPCLKIPYTEAKTGSKIVDSNYRSRVEDCYEQFGTGNYYVLDEDNKEVDLPRPDIYGLIASNAGGGGTTYTAGTGITITTNNEISLSSDTQTELTTLSADVAALDADKQDKLTAGTGITISNNTIASTATGNVVENGTNVSRSWNNFGIVGDNLSIQTSSNDQGVTSGTFDSENYILSNITCGDLGKATNNWWRIGVGWNNPHTGTLLSLGEGTYLEFDYDAKILRGHFRVNTSEYSWQETSIECAVSDPSSVKTAFLQRNGNLWYVGYTYDETYSSENVTISDSLDLYSTVNSPTTPIKLGCSYDGSSNFGTGQLRLDRFVCDITGFTYSDNVKESQLYDSDNNAIYPINPNKQDKLVAGDGITIENGNVISASATEYQGGSYIDIDNGYINWTYDSNSLLTVKADDTAVSVGIAGGENGEKYFQSVENYNSLTETYGDPTWQLKGGSYQVYQPHGASSFSSANVPEGTSVEFGYGSSSPHLVYPSLGSSDKLLTQSSSLFYTGSTAPDSHVAIWLDTDNMVIKEYNSSSSSWEESTNLYIPIGIANVTASSSSEGSVGFIQLFRPFNMFNDCILASGCEIAIPNGRNAYGRMQYTKSHAWSNITHLGITATGTYWILWDADNTQFKAIESTNFVVGNSVPSETGTYVYNLQDNFVYTKDATTGAYTKVNVAPVAKATYDGDGILSPIHLTGFEPCSLVYDLVSRTEATLRGYNTTTTSSSSSSSEGIL